MYYRNQNDETLVMLTLAGDPDAYEALVVRYEKSVLAAAMSVTRTRFMAEDAAQDAFITAWMKLNCLREADKFGAWVCRIAKNIAKNTVLRYKSYLPFETFENVDLEQTRDLGDDPQEYAVLSEQKEELHKSIGRLPKKVRAIIYYHYFEGLSVASIAEKLRISEGTVKSQLHDGRKRLRKELSAMNENINDTLVEKVMKKVEELKLWNLKSSKDGFDKVYQDVLRDVEELPESRDKYHALADVLMRGWWWLPGEKNDALFARIKEAAELGKNDDVMVFVVTREDKDLYGKKKIEFIRDTQIPRLEKTGFKLALAKEWSRLGYNYFEEKELEKGIEACSRVFDIIDPSEVLYSEAKMAIDIEKLSESEYKGKNPRRFRLQGGAEELRFINGVICDWGYNYDATGSNYSVAYDSELIFNRASRCDGRFFIEGLKVGESYTGSNSTLVFEADDVTLDVPAGHFDGCQAWRYNSKSGEVIISYYKDGVGIIKQICKRTGFTESRMLKAYSICGGKGLLPCVLGNHWEYTADYKEGTVDQFSEYTVSYADNAKIILSFKTIFERISYDKDSWLDAIIEIRNEYWQEVDGKHRIADVSDAIERAQKLAKTPLEKAHTKAACAVAKRIMETDKDFNPDRTSSGHWNFFKKNIVKKQDGDIRRFDDFRWSFEWKAMGMAQGDTGAAMLYNDIYGIWKDAMNDRIWSDDWAFKDEFVEEFMLWSSYSIKTTIRRENIGSMTTKAGTFDNCIKFALDIKGLEDEPGLCYRGGRKDYYFADGVGIIRVETDDKNSLCKCVYELTEYEGVGEGYMPCEDGFYRRYDAIDIGDGYVGYAKYYYAADEDGTISIFDDRCGVKDPPPKIMRYSSLFPEKQEKQLWSEGKKDECLELHDLNNFKLMLHFLYRDWYNSDDKEKILAVHRQRLRIIESFGENGEIPEAWVGFYSFISLALSSAYFMCDRKDEGYSTLKLAMELQEKWLEHNGGDELDVGNVHVFGKIKAIANKRRVRFEDGREEPVSEFGRMFNVNSALFYANMKKGGWEGFQKVIDEPEYKVYLDKAESFFKDLNKNHPN